MTMDTQSLHTSLDLANSLFCEMMTMMIIREVFVYDAVWKSQIYFTFPLRVLFFYYYSQVICHHNDVIKNSRIIEAKKNTELDKIVKWEQQKKNFVPSIFFLSSSLSSLLLLFFFITIGWLILYRWIRNSTKG